jgi:signal transduction histidine kinase
MGLMNMQERMESIGGTVSIRSAPGKGTRVHASIPLRDAA